MPIFLLKICCCYLNTHVHSFNKYIYDTIKLTKIRIYSHTFDTHLILHSSTSRLFGVNVIERSVLPRIHVAAFWPWPTKFVFVVNNKICSRTKTVYTHTHTCRLQQFAPHFAVNKNCVIIKSDPEKRLRDKQAANWRPEFFSVVVFFYSWLLMYLQILTWAQGPTIILCSTRELSPHPMPNIFWFFR